MTKSTEHHHKGLGIGGLLVGAIALRAVDRELQRRHKPKKKAAKSKKSCQRRSR